ncbi:MAG TPA: type II toxin-antitoxin system PemK/MazF family toxin [Pirellulaceae bacterium]|nr:type II toxin-antitoxin system PemK/MazF family toxin [Pirellulaceae bacterium]
MTTYAPGEIVLVDFPFVSGAAAALRPALVVLDTGDSDVVLARITTKSHTSGHDVAIADWRGAGLRAASFVRLHKLATAEKPTVFKRLGSLQPPDHQRVAAILKGMFNSW